MAAEHPVDRAAIATDLERARTEFHHLLAEAERHDAWDTVAPRGVVYAEHAFRLRLCGFSLCRETCWGGNVLLRIVGGIEKCQRGFGQLAFVGGLPFVVGFDEHRARLQHNPQRQTDGYSTEAQEDHIRPTSRRLGEST